MTNRKDFRMGNIAIFIYLSIIVVGIPAIILLAYKKIYSNYVNKKLKNQSYNSDIQDGRIPDSHTGGKVIVFILLWGSLSSIQSKISDVQEKLDYQQSVAEDRLDEINERLDEIEEANEKANRKNNMVSELDVDFGELGADHRTANFVFTVSLNKYDKDSTYYLLVGDEKKKVLLNEDEVGELKGNTDLDIFGEYTRIVCVKQDAAGNKEREKFDLNYDELSDNTIYFTNGCDGEEDCYLYTKFLLDTYYSMEEEEESTSANGKRIKLNASIYAGLDKELSDNGIKEAKVYVESDGKIVDEKNLDKNKLYSDNGCRFKYDKKIEGKEISIYYKITDAYGYSFKGYLWTNDDRFEDCEEYEVIVSDENDKQIFEKIY
ncbi:hypothetical protein [Eubacterium sp.]|uniref:hypothetical protein n=1 Tax=Eubacterium sp. TaxID=142586 RepID=UPI0025FAAC3F|nr:hypothetical protein [Eubacterium sp.]MCR5628829.1 hypothetical protein [Eubacterium sp.]